MLPVVNVEHMIIYTISAHHYEMNERLIIDTLIEWQLRILKL